MKSRQRGGYSGAVSEFQHGCALLDARVPEGRWKFVRHPRPRPQRSPRAISRLSVDRLRACIADSAAWTDGRERRHSETRQIEAHTQVTRR